MKIREKWFKEHSKYIFLLILVVTAPKLVIAIMSNPIQVTGDFGNLVAPAYFAGLDWSYLSGIVDYYGTGYHILFTPLFWITDNPFIIYKVILSSYALLETIVAFIIYYLCNKHLIIENKLVSCFSAIIIVYLRVTKVTFISNESIILLIVWLTILLMFELYNQSDNYKARRVMTILLVIVLSYSLTIHTRNIAIIVFTIITLGYMLICKKKCFISLFVCGIAGIFFGGLAYLYKSQVIELVWMQNRIDTDLHNSNSTYIISRLDRIFLLFEKDYLYAFLNTIVGQIDTVNIMAGGFFVFAVLLCLCIIYLTIIKKQLGDWNIYCGILAVFGLLGCLGLLGVQAVTWLNITKGAMDLGYGSRATYFKSFTYIRYFEPFIGPVILTAIAYIEKHKAGFVYIISATFTLLGQIYWYRWIVPFVYNDRVSATFYIPFTFGSYQQQCTWMTYLPGTIVMIIMLVVIGFLLKKKLIPIITILLSVFVMYQYLYWGFVHENEWINRADAGYQLIEKLENEVTIEDTIIVPYKAMAYTYQVMLNRYHITMEMPQKDESALIFTNRMNNSKYDEYIIDYGYTAYVLDSNEYLYVKDIKIIEIMDEWGYQRFVLK